MKNYFVLVSKDGKYPNITNDPYIFEFGEDNSKIKKAIKKVFTIYL